MKYSGNSFPAGALFRHKYHGEWEYGRFAEKTGVWNIHGTKPKLNNTDKTCIEGYWKGESFILRKEIEIGKIK